MIKQKNLPCCYINYMFYNIIKNITIFYITRLLIIAIIFPPLSAFNLRDMSLLILFIIIIIQPFNNFNHLIILT